MLCDKSNAPEPKPINLSLPTTKAVQFVVLVSSWKRAFLSHGFSKELSVGLGNGNLQFINKIRAVAYIVLRRCFVLKHKFFISLNKILFS